MAGPPEDRTPTAYGAVKPDGDPRSLRTLAAAYLDWLAVHNYSSSSVEHRGYGLGYFIAWCDERGLRRAAEVTRPVLKRYQRHLFYYRSPKGKPLGVSTQYMRLSILCGFFRWATKQDYLLFNPAADLELPRPEKRLPRAVFTVEEVEQVLAQANVDEPVGLRDRAMMETLYSTGMRRMELAGLHVIDVDRGRGVVMIRLGKGKKDRLVPIGERALAWITKYLDEVRPQLAIEPDEGYLFLNTDGGPLGHSYLGTLVRRYVLAAGIGKRGSCHIFRHTCATLMLDAGADIRHVQEMLGHEELSSTQIYTHLSIEKLKAVHLATHPGARLARTPKGNRNGIEPGPEAAATTPDPLDDPSEHGDDDGR